MALRELFAKFDIQFGTTELSRGSDQVTAAIGNVRALGAAVRHSELVQGVRDFASEFVQSANEIAGQSARLGISAQAMQELGFAASAAGQDLDTMVDAMSTLQERARDAVLDPQSDPARQLKLLGVEARDAQGNLKSAERLITEVSDGLMGMETQTDRVGAAMTLFGDVGRELLPIMQDGSEGLDALRVRARELGGGLSDASIAAGAQLGTQIGELEFSLQSLRSQIALALLPTINRVVAFITQATATIFELTEGTHVLELVMIALGAAALIMGAKMLAGFAIPLAIMALVIVVVGLIIIVVDDLITLFEGGESVIGEFIDALFGVGTAQQVVTDLKLAWEGLALAIGRAAEALGLISDFDDEIANEEQTQEEIAERQVRAAALSGSVQRTAAEREAGMTMEEARARANQIRLREGLDTAIGEDFNERALTRGELAQQRAGGGGGGGGSTSGQVRPSRRERANQTTNIEQGDTQVTIEGVTDTQLPRLIENVMRRRQEIDLRQTLDAVTQEVDEE